MKKFMSLLLALLLVASLGSAAFADGYTDMSAVTLTVTYNETNEGSISPAETLAFTIARTSVTDAAEGVTAENMPIPILGTVSYAEGDAGKDGAMTKSLTITLPSYSSVGIYTYTIKQTAGTNAGVEYWSKDIRLVVTVIQDAVTGLIRVAAVHTEGTGGEKSDDITNTYSAGSLAVTKTVTGNMGDRDKYFAIKVTLTGEAGKTYQNPYTVSGGSKLTDGTAAGTTTSISVDGKSHTFYLKHGETFTIENLPYGVTYTVAEADYTTEGYEEAEIIFPDQNKKIDTASETVGITNNKQATVDTGIVLDSLPYVLLLVLSIGGAVLFLLKRRSSRES